MNGFGFLPSWVLEIILISRKVKKNTNKKKMVDEFANHPVRAIWVEQHSNEDRVFDLGSNFTDANLNPPTNPHSFPCFVVAPAKRLMYLNFVILPSTHPGK